MSAIVSVHSFRGGTGKIATLLAAEGRRVGVIDTDIQSPGIHVPFGLDEEQMSHSLNDYLWGKCDIKQTAHDVTPDLGRGSQGRVFLIPSSIKAGDIARVLREGYDVGLLNDGVHELVSALDLDVLLIDTHPGLNEETLLSIAISDALAIILRPTSRTIRGRVSPWRWRANWACPAWSWSSTRCPRCSTRRRSRREWSRRTGAK